MAEASYFCPMCGAPFDLGADRCVSCASPLPAAAPNLRGFEAAALQRSQGPTLAGHALRQGGSLLWRNPYLLILPLFVSAFLAWALQSAILNERRAVGGAGFQAVLLPAVSASPASIPPLVYTQITSLVVPGEILKVTGASFGLFGLSIPPVGVTHAPALAASMLGVPTLPVPIARFTSLFVCLSAASLILLNLIQWILILGATEPEWRSKPWNYMRACLSAAAPMLLMAVLPYMMEVARPALTASLPSIIGFIEGMTYLALVVWATAATVASAFNCETSQVVKRAVFSTEGICFLFMALPLLWIVRLILLVWQSGLIPVFAGDAPAASFLAGTCCCGLCLIITTYVTASWLILLRQTILRNDISSMIDRTERPRQAGKSPSS